MEERSEASLRCRRSDQRLRFAEAEAETRLRCNGGAIRGFIAMSEERSEASICGGGGFAVVGGAHAAIGGLVKILKKYDKRTGALIRLPFIQKVLQQPFFTTDLLNKLVKECESMLDRLFPKNETSVSRKDDEGEGDNGDDDPSKPQDSSLVRGRVPDLEEIKYIESLYMKSTVSALRVLKEIRSGSSTVSVFSLPPLQTSGAEERIWDKVPVLEQLAK